MASTRFSFSAAAACCAATAERAALPSPGAPSPFMAGCEEVEGIKVPAAAAAATAARSSAKGGCVVEESV